MDLDLFNASHSVEITQFGGPFNDNDPTSGIYRIAGINTGIIVCSTATADRLLTTIDRALPNFNLTSARHIGSGALESNIAGTSSLTEPTMIWSLFDGPQGSALMCLPSASLFPDFLRRFHLDTSTKSGIVVREWIFGNGHTSAGAAAAIGMGSVVAPWYVPGFEHTHEAVKGDQQAVDGYAIRLMSANLVHALESWQQKTFNLYRKRYTASVGEVSIYAIGGLDDETLGPKLLMPLEEMTEQDLYSALDGIERFGPCRPYLFLGLGTILCDLDPHATADQVDTRVHELLDTVDRWLHRNDGNAPTASTPASTPPSAPAPAGSGSRRLHDALKARLDVTSGRSPASTSTASNPISGA